MGVVDELVRAREAYERRDWLAAFESLSGAGPDDGDDFDRLGAAALLVGRKNDCVTAYQRAFQAHLDAGEPMAAVRSAFFLGYELVSTWEPAVAAGWRARAGRLVEEAAPGGAADVPEQGYLLILDLLVEVGRGGWEEAARLATEITGYGRRFPDPNLLAMGLASEGRLATRSGRVQSGLALLDEAMAVLTATETSPIISGDVYCSMIEACQDLSDFGRAAQWTTTLAGFCDSQPGLVAFTGQCALHRGQIMRVRGAFGEALEEFRAAIARYLAAGTPQPAGSAHGEAGNVLRLLGEYAAAEEEFAQSIALGFDPQPGLALLWLERGREADALAAVRRLLGEPRDVVGRTQVLPGAITVLLAVGEDEQAGVLAAELSAAADEIGCDALRAMAARATGNHLAATGRAAAAVPELRHAAQVWTGLSAPYEVARCRLDLGRALLALEDAASAAGEVAAARATFARLGAAPDERAAAALLDPSPPDGLTARETEVLRLVAAGRTNPEIAAMLVLSEKTVARHLSNIFSKVGVRTRTAAAAYAFEHRLV